MEYSIRELADLAGISTRTLRYYDEIDLLKPCKVNENGMRFYGKQEVDLLQQIMFYREHDVKLDVIQQIIHQPDFDVEEALKEHLSVLLKKKERILALIRTVELTLDDWKGAYYMSDQVKFEAFKESLVEKHEQKYGKEAREKYGDESVDASHKKILNMTEQDYERFQNLEKEVLRQLEEAVKEGAKPDSETGKRIVMLHKEWLGFTWKEYTAQAHNGLVQMYLADDRFLQYYNRNVNGCAEFLVAAVQCWAK